MLESAASYSTFTRLEVLLLAHALTPAHSRYFTERPSTPAAHPCPLCFHDGLPRDRPHTANASPSPPSDGHSPTQRRPNRRPPTAGQRSERRDRRSATDRPGCPGPSPTDRTGRRSSVTASRRLGPTVCAAGHRPVQRLGMAPTQGSLTATDLWHPHSGRGACPPGLITKEAAALSAGVQSVGCDALHEVPDRRPPAQPDHLQTPLLTKPRPRGSRRLRRQQPQAGSGPSVQAGDRQACPQTQQCSREKGHGTDRAGPWASEPPSAPRRVEPQDTQDARPTVHACDEALGPEPGQGLRAGGRG